MSLPIPLQPVTPAKASPPPPTTLQSESSSSMHGPPIPQPREQEHILEIIDNVSTQNPPTVPPSAQTTSNGHSPILSPLTLPSSNANEQNLPQTQAVNNTQATRVTQSNHSSTIIEPSPSSSFTRIESRFTSSQEVPSVTKKRALLKTRFSFQKLSSQFSTWNKTKYWTPKSSGEGENQWGVHWSLPTWMIFLGLAGITSAVSHHLYNQRLHGNIVENSDWTQRFGLAIAFLVKVCLVGAVEIAYKQKVWFIYKKRLLKIETIDSLFSACSDPLKFVNSEFLLKATIPFLLAALTWALPLCAIASPASLTSVTSIRNSSAICDGVPSLNFSKEIQLPWESPYLSITFVQRFPGIANDSDYYDGPSSHLKKDSIIFLYQGTEALQPSNPCPESGNCSYILEFEGPAYDCQEKSDYEPAANTSMTKEKLIPTGNFSYFGLSSVYENDYGAPLWWDYPETPEDEIGLFLEEPSLWLGYTINTTVPLIEPITTNWGARWYHEFTQHVIQCSMHAAIYRHSVLWSNGVMSLESSTTKLIKPILAFSPYENPEYAVLSAYHAAGWLFRTQLHESINQTGDAGTQDYAITSSQVSMTKLVDPISQFVVPDFPSAVEKLFANLILSLASDPALAITANYSVPCIRNSIVLVWKYEPFWLVLSYSLATGFMMIAVGFGIWAFKENGYGVNMGFSGIVLTTRNSELRGLSEGHCLGAYPANKEFMKKKLRFGELAVDGGVHTAFGTEGNVGQIVKGKKYI